MADPDIIERLREAAAHLVCEDGCDVDKVMREAADLIERLRATVVAADRAIKASHADFDLMRAEMKLLQNEIEEYRR